MPADLQLRFESVGFANTRNPPDSVAERIAVLRLSSLNSSPTETVETRSASAPLGYLLDRHQRCRRHHQRQHGREGEAEDDCRVR
jgi:hypothetical protein